MMSNAPTYKTDRNQVLEGCKAPCKDEVVERLLILLNVTLGIRQNCAAWYDEEHEELYQHGPFRHVHALLCPALRSTFVVRDAESGHASVHKENRKHWAIID